MDILLIIPFFMGLATGSLINYLADVLPVTRSLSQPACQICHEKIEIRDYLIWRSCPNGHQRTIRTFIVQIAGIAMSIFVWVSPPEALGYVLGMVLFIYFGVVFVVDLEHRLILHQTSIFGFVLGLIVGILKRGWTSTLLGALVGFLIMLSLYYLGVLFSRYRTRRMKAAGLESDDEEALGAGDVILVTVLGLVIGWPLIWFGLLLGILLGGAVSLLILATLLVTRKYSTNSLMIFLPYGPYLVTSAVVIIFFPDLIKAILPG